MVNINDAATDGLTGWFVTGSNSNAASRFPELSAVPQAQHRQNLSATQQSPQARRVTSVPSRSWRPNAPSAAATAASDHGRADLAITAESSPPRTPQSALAAGTSADKPEPTAAARVSSPPTDAPAKNPHSNLAATSSSGSSVAATVSVGTSSEFFSTLAQQQQAVQRQNAHKANVSDRGRRWLQQKYVRQRQRQRFLAAAFEAGNDRNEIESESDRGGRPGTHSGIGPVRSAPLVPVEWRRAGVGSGRVALGAGHIEGDGYSDGFVDGYGYGDARDYITSAAGVRKRASVDARGRGSRGGGGTAAAAAAATAVVAARRMMAQLQTQRQGQTQGRARALAGSTSTPDAPTLDASSSWAPPPPGAPSSTLAHSVMARLEELVRGHARRQQQPRVQAASVGALEAGLLGVLDATRAVIFRTSAAVETENQAGRAPDEAEGAETERAAAIPFFDRVRQLRAEREQLEQALQTQRAEIEQARAQIAAKTEEVRSVRTSATQDEFGLNVEVRKTNKLGLKVHTKEKAGEAVEAERIRLERTLKGVRHKTQELQGKIQSSAELLRSEQKMQKALERRQMKRGNSNRTVTSGSVAQDA